MRDDSWIEELWRLFLFVLAGVTVGILLDNIYPVTLLFMTAYIARYLYHVQRLSRWLEDPENKEIPAHFGVWGRIYANICRHLSNYRQRERRLKTLLEQFQASAAALPDAVITLGPNDEIRGMNEAAQQLLGLRAPEDYGRPLVNLFRAPTFQEFLATRNFSQPLELNAPGAEIRRLLLRVVPYGEEQLLVIIQDISDRYRIERIRRDFVANVSHELRTPLTVISGFVENMQASPDICPDAWRRPLELIVQQAERMRHIVEDLLLLARLEGGEKNLRRDVIDVAEMLGHLADEARLLTSEDIDIAIDIKSTWGLIGDFGLLRSAIGNLVINAVHHTPPGGTITLHWEDEPDASCIIVEDTGEGIAPEHIPRLTERFYRVDSGRSRERGGTGLGLAIVKHVLQVHEAGLEIDSTPGEGSRFICRFPVNGRVEMAEADSTAVDSR